MTISRPKENMQHYTLKYLQCTEVLLSCVLFNCFNLKDFFLDCSWPIYCRLHGTCYGVTLATFSDADRRVFESNF